MFINELSTLSKYIVLPISTIYIVKIIIELIKVQLFGSPIKIIHSFLSNKKDQEQDLDSNDKTKIITNFIKSSSCLNGLNNYIPTFWLNSAHIMSLLSSFDQTNIVFSRETINYLDGGSTSLDWYPTRPTNKEENDGIPLIILIHGITGSSSSNYIQDLIDYFSSQGCFRFVVFHARGLDREIVTSKRLSNSYDTSDLRYCIHHFKRLLPHSRLIPVGFSMGANLLVKYLGEHQEDSLCYAAVSISNPFDMLYVSRHMDHHFFKRHTYARFLSKNLSSIYKINETILKPLNIVRKNWYTLMDFDRDVTIKSAGFSSVLEYYRMSSSDLYLKKVKIPLMILHALDDPIVTPEALPVDEVMLNPNVFLALTEHGGHLGWRQGVFNQHHYWSTILISEFLEYFIKL